MFHFALLFQIFPKIKEFSSVLSPTNRYKTHNPNNSESLPKKVPEPINGAYMVVVLPPKKGCQYIAKANWYYTSSDLSFNLVSLWELFCTSL